jgi:DmsE family decaheme c-type cytochrome
MKLWQRVATLLAFAAGMAGTNPAVAADSAVAASRALEKDAVCTKCHDESEQKPVLAMYKTRHGVKADSRTPGCQTCHGASDDHVKNPKGTAVRPVPDVVFGAKSKTSPQAKSDACVSCHQSGKRIHWAGSTHQSRDVACTSCHEVHTHSDKVLTKTTQSEVCFTCHKDQRAQINKPSRHPIKEGKVSCSDCHNPHGSTGPNLMVRDNVVDTCYTCHMEKRGPFVRSHQPVQEDCSICHNPHGTTTPNLLKTRPPFLCQQCHEPTGHRGGVASLNGTSTGANTAARGCLNCHTQIHGTNNPANISNERTFRR